MSSPTVRLFRRLIGKEISVFSRHFDHLYIVSMPPEAKHQMLDVIECPRKDELDDYRDFPEFTSSDTRSLIVLDGVVNYDHDIQKILESVYRKASRQTRLAIVTYNPYLKWIFRIANSLNIRKGRLPSNFVTMSSLRNLARLSRWEIVRYRPTGLCPVPLMYLDRLINWIGPLVPFAGYLSLSAIIVFRPVIRSEKLSLSIVIPARNERGNIENAVKRLEYLKDVDLELIFVEGHSEDNTWNEIERVKHQYRGPFSIRVYRQPGKGKSDAVRLGLARAQKDLVTILDADLTTEPEFMGRFLEAYQKGLADFINGNRLILPMEKGAMGTLNFFGNLFFAKLLNRILQLDIGDSLCGTKMFSRSDYQRIVQWREGFGGTDPFGDFEMLFGASQLCLGTIDVPVIYRARSYGTTNISRFSHGWMLLKMTAIGLLRIKAGRV